MGFLSDDNSDANDLAQEQFAQNQAELERKKRDLYKTRLDIIKGQGAQQWTPNFNAGNSGKVGYGANASPYPENLQKFLNKFK
jgi:hypothetical protein